MGREKVWGNKEKVRMKSHVLSKLIKCNQLSYLDRGKTPVNNFM